MSTLRCTLQIDLSDAAVPLDQLPQRAHERTLTANKHMRRTLSVSSGTSVTLDYGEIDPADAAFLYIENIGASGTIIVRAGDQIIAELAPRSSASTADGQFLFLWGPTFQPYVDVDSGTGTLMFWVQQA